MSQLPDCPEWEYRDHPRKEEVFSYIIPRILTRLRKGTLDAQSVAGDTRLFHRCMFVALAPNGYGYYAGHYRGENFRCLKHYTVCIAGDDRVGSSPDFVWDNIHRLTDVMLAGIAAIDDANKFPQVQLSESEKLQFLIAFVAGVFVEFLTVHPYANGNGHVGRLLVWAVLLRYGYEPKGWPLHPRPLEPYSDLIKRHRSGNSEPLEIALIRHVLLGQP